MDLGVKWFCNDAVLNKLLTFEVCNELINALGDDVDLLVFAQAVLDHGLSDDVDMLQKIMEGAFQKSTDGLYPESDLFSENNQAEVSIEEDSALEQSENLSSNIPIASTEKKTLADIPPLTDLDSKSDADIVELMKNLLKTVRSIGASDLHLSAGAIPFVRLNLEIKNIGDRVLSYKDSERLNYALLTKGQADEYREKYDYDLALALDKVNRFRVNLMKHKQGYAGTYRMIPDKISSLAELGFTNHKVMEKLLDHNNGLILITGPVGSGKTTTLAAMVNILNKKRYDHIIAVENPIEIVQYSDKCNITQREVGTHTKSFATALKGALREDPDIIVIGELRDLETIEMAITAAETGHLVIGTLHTNDAANTLNRLLDVFPPEQQQQIRAMTSESLRGIICQKLLPTSNNQLVIAAEILINTIAVANIIRDGNTHMLKGVLQTGSKLGMQLMEESIYNLYQSDKISKETALSNINDKEIVGRINAPIVTEEEPIKKKGWFK